MKEQAGACCCITLQSFCITAPCAHRGRAHFCAQVAHTNQVAIKTDMMKGALEALLEVRREALNKAFGMTKGGMSSEVRSLA